MVRVLIWAALGLAAAGALSAVALALRRLHVARSERSAAEAEARLQPVALALLDGDAGAARHLGARDAEVLARILTRVGRRISGSARERLAEFFERSGGVEREVARLGDRRAWSRATAAYLLGDMASAGQRLSRSRARDGPGRRSASRTPLRIRLKPLSVRAGQEAGTSLRSIPILEAAPRGGFFFARFARRRFAATPFTLSPMDSKQVVCAQCGTHVGTLTAHFPDTEGTKVIRFSPAQTCAHIQPADVDEDRQAIYYGGSRLLVETREHET